MAFARRVFVLAAGAAVGVGTAPYLHRQPTLSDPDRTNFHGLHGCGRGISGISGISGGGAAATARYPAEHGTTDAPHDRIDDVSASSAVAALGEAVGGLLSTTARVLMAAMSVAASHRVASAATVEEASQAAHLDAVGADADADASSAPACASPALDERTAAFRAAPHKLKDRFLHYAKRDPASGEFVLSLDGFVRCMLLLPEEDGDDRVTAVEQSDTAATESLFAAALRGRAAGAPHMSSTSSPSSWLQRLPPSVRQRFVHFFRWVDLDCTNSIGYAEFVVLFTFLSTPRQTLERAFTVFDLDNNGRLSEWEFCRLLNTIMVDPAVQVRYSDTPADRAGGATAPAEPPRDTASRAGASRRSERERRHNRDALRFEIASELMRPLLFGPLPRHVGAPPGSTHYCGNAVVAATVSSSLGSVSEAAADTASSPAWWRQSVHTLRRLLDKVWPSTAVSGTPASVTGCTGAVGAVLPLASVTAPPTATPSRMAQLQLVAQEDALLQLVSYSAFLYRLDYLRWELRAIEFGLCDPSNSGAITLADCRRLLRGGDSRGTAGETGDDAAQQRGGDLTVSWQSYQKVFDVVKESEKIMAALQLTLDAMPPVPEETLRGGAIPDEALDAATQAIPTLARLSAQRHTSASTTAAVERTASESSGEDRRGFVSADVMATDAAAGRGADEQRAAARHVQTLLVRPTALTWRQFNHVLATLGAVPQLSDAEAALFQALFDDDGSDSLSPTEFARLCALKDRFFAQQLPRFDMAKRNTVQQFFYCMQQLE